MNLKPAIRTTLAAALLAAFPCHASAAAAPSAAAPIRDGAYYGTNYTVPFAHAYRALGALGVDRKEAIRRDAYHLSRIGLNAFRLHLWDVELSDAQGNLLDKDNDHLDLLDYLIAELEKRGMAVVLTAQTNFGNGYPERNTDPNGAFSYDYPKCDVHDNPAAQNAQARYLDALVRHVNPYTGRSYAADPSILAIEINNEPCHSGSQEEITAYVNRMADTLRAAGWNKEILYNVSHNLWRTQAFYDAKIDGTTFQWYPTGLVHGSERRANFLPVLDDYHIPFDTIRDFGRPSRVIYEYDPADVLATYLYPAAARTFRKAGFNWITQFAYDPIDMAAHNTEYQTHFLNLAYTPGKAIGMLIAAEATRRIPAGKDFGKYPVDTVFGDFLVSARRDLAMFNDGEHYYHTNSTAELPKSPKKLRAIAGVGSSPLVTTDGTGAYFLDLVGVKKGVWRLEVMPDVKLTEDPFRKPSLSRTVGKILTRPVKIDLSGLLGKDFSYLNLTQLGKAPEATSTGTITVAPGVYLLAVGEKALAGIDPETVFGDRRNMKIGEYVAPRPDTSAPVLVHRPAQAVAPGSPLRIQAEWISDTEPDSIVVYPASASFWNEHNRLFPMEKTGKYSYSVTLDADDAFEGKKDGSFKYRIVVFDRDGIVKTWPGGTEGTPLSWDYGAGQPSGETPAWSVDFLAPGAPMTLLRPAPDMDASELSTIPEAWRGVSWHYSAPLAEAPALVLSKGADAETDTLVVSKYIADAVSARGASDMDARTTLRVHFGKGAGNLTVGFVTRDGFTYSAPVRVTPDGYADVPLAGLRLDDTLLTPAPYPSFLSRRFVPDAATSVPFSPAEIETLTLVLAAPAGQSAEVEVRGVELL